MQSNIRVLMISENYPHPNDPSSGGAWLFNQIGAYNEYVDISLIVPVHLTPSISSIMEANGIGGRLRKIANELKTLTHSKYPPFSWPVNGKYVRFASLPPKQLFPFSGGILLALRLACSLFADNNFDVLHAQSLLHEGISSVLLGKIFGRPSLVTAIGSDVHAVRKNSITYRTTRLVLRQATLITTVSAELKERIIEMGIPGDKIIVVPNGVDPDFATRHENMDVRKMMNVPKAARVFGFVGRLIPVKDPMTLMRAFAKLSANRNDVYLILVGDGELRRPLQEEARKLAVSERVRFSEGLVPLEQVASYMQAFDYLCVSSKAEGWPNVILEAMVCGKPVIATDVGGNREAVITDGLGLLVPAQDPDALSNAMDQALRAEWDGKSIMQYAKSHTWNEVGKRYFEIYSSLVSNRSCDVIRK